ncbi:hypothetical protein [Burkholderia cepacia]|uniref:hypothetical protein n=1 Tax=Burkholderia cepacia TaxID=292 RepID=UPI00075DDBDE|nr:hypothetical protein [Burkholderia cepacia]KVX48893.1 hypothetical protein WL06_30710 [Burkholderia cepacia]KWD57768.1 hypothetical protein WL68_29015 [Burkholderia cepacia]KWD82657.1 hypothetical protein WL69_16750 [Burkholderia cepacia]
MRRPADPEGRQAPHAITLCGLCKGHHASRGLELVVACASIISVDAAMEAALRDGIVQCGEAAATIAPTSNVD